MQHWLYFDANYTFANNQADNQGDAPSSFAGEVNYGGPIANRFNVKSDLGNIEGTRRHRSLLTGVYQLPFGRGRNFMSGGGVKDAFLGGWDLTTVTLLESGPWLTPSISAGGCQVQAKANGFCPAAVSPTPVGAGRFGNAGVGILQGPGTAAVSLGVAKSFRITEKVHARFESTFTNVLNRTNFAPPATVVDSPSTFGALIGAQTAENAGNRTGQAAPRGVF